MRTILLALALTAFPAAALAQPPAEGTVHTFYDPLFTGTVFCDTLEQVRSIATADTPAEVFTDYLLTANELNEPTCAAIVPTGTVVAVTPLGVMEQDGLHFHAYAIETRIDDATGYALYLEPFRLVYA